jgi:branched-chain amino acid transport system ATP-binding protein
MSLLSVENVTAGYGDVQVLWGIDLRVEQGEIVALIGSNGVGKSTLLRTISGLLPTRSGRIMLGDADIGGLPPDQVVAAGIIHVPEGRRLFAAMNVRDNLLMGAYHRRDGTPCTSAACRTRRRCPAANSRCVRSHAGSWRRRGS